MAQRATRAQIPLALVIASTITLATLILAALFVAQNFYGLEEAKLRAASVSTRQLADSIDDRIRVLSGPPSTALEFLRYDPITQADDLQERLDRLPAITSAMSGGNLVSAVYVGYANGDFFLFRPVAEADLSRFSEVPPGAQYLLQTITTDKTGSKVPDFLFLNERYSMIRRITPENYDYDPRQRPWYDSAVESNETVLSAPYTFFTTGETGLTFSRHSAAYALRSESSELGYLPNAVIGIDVTVADLSDQLQKLKYTPGTRIAVVNQDNQILASTERDGDGLHSAIAQLLQNRADPLNDETTRLFTIDGSGWWGLAEPVSEIGGQTLTIAVAIPEDELMAEVWESLQRQTLLAIIVALFLLIIGWFIGRNAGRALELLTDRVESLTRFRFDTSLRIRSRVREAHKLSRALDDMARTINGFQTMATVMNRGQDLNNLLQDVLDQIIRIVGQRRGALYLSDQHKGVLELSVNRELDVPRNIGGIAADDDDNDLIRKLRDNISGHPVFAILRNRSRKLIGALVIEMENGEQQLTDELIVFVDEVAGAAAVAIETRELIESQQALLEGFIRLVATAIDAKSPYTGGHCERVPKLAQMMLEQAFRSDDPPFRHFSMTEEERYEFHLAAWLHDCGKITTAEYVVDKAVKLETIYNRIHEIRTRFEVLHRDAEIACLQQLQAGAPEDEALRQKRQIQQALQEDFAFIAQANLGGEFMAEEDIERIHRIGERQWQRHFSDRLGLSYDEALARAAESEPSLPVSEKLLDDKPWHVRSWGERKPPVQRDNPNNRWGFDMTAPEHKANLGELYNLTVRKGTLNDEERFEINNHIVQTICMLDALPLPDWLARVPHLAGTHHERMDGGGYPCGLTEQDMGIPERIMAVADVFEALTAIDRPYKEGKTLTESLTIMRRMVDDKHLDPDTFILFVRSGTYRQYAEEFMQPNQRDAVDEDAILEGL